MAKKVLVVDDEKLLVKGMKFNLENEGYEVMTAYDGAAAVELEKKENFDLIVMDVMMPELDGFSACREIRRKSQVPVIMLSARGEEYDRIHGFELGIDDYVVKPFSPRELMMRVSAVLKRTAANVPAASDGERVTIGDMVVDFAARQVTIKGERLNLSPKEYDLLFYMCRNHQDRFPEIHCFAYRFKSCRAGICLASCHLPEKDRIIQLIERQGIIYSFYRLFFPSVPEEPERYVRIFFVPLVYILGKSGINHIAMDIIMLRDFLIEYILS